MVILLTATGTTEVNSVGCGPFRKWPSLVRIVNDASSCEVYLTAQETDKNMLIKRKSVKPPIFSINRRVGSMPTCVALLNAFVSFGLHAYPHRPNPIP